MSNASRRWARVFGPAVVVLAIGIPIQQASAANSAPALKTAPQVTGTTTVGQTLTTTSGTWTGTPTPTYTYQWQRCVVGGSCSNATTSSATKTTYLLTSSDKGKQIRSKVVAKNSVGSKTAYSARTATIAAAVSKPGKLTSPSINSTPPAVAGNILTLNQGTWSGSPTLADSWQRCNGATCAAVGSGTSYQLQATDVGQTMKVVETATNSAGSTQASSAATAAVADAPAVSPGAPTITPPNPLQDGSQLTGVDPGTWGGTNVTLTYTWESSANGIDTWTPVQNTSSATYTATSNDVGDWLRVTTVGHNSAGDVPSTPSDPVGQVAAAPLAEVQPPVIGGQTQINQTLTATQGTFSGTNPSAPSFIWYRCASTAAAPDDASCQSVSNASSYLLVPSDQDSIFFVTDTRTGDATPLPGLTVASDPTPKIAGPAPQNTAAPTIDSTAPQVGQTLTADSPGTWTPDTATFTYTYAWSSCDPVDTTNCTAETLGGNAQTYVVRTFDQGRVLRVHVTATDQYSQQASADSATTSTVTRQAGSVFTVANWAMDEQSGTVMNDASTYNNWGTLYNVGLGQVDNGLNVAYGFPAVTGQTSKVVVEHSPSLNPDGVNNFNISMHVKISALPDPATVGDYDLMRKGQSTDSNDWKLEILNVSGAGQARCYINDGVHAALAADAAVSLANWGLASGGTGKWVTITCKYTNNSVTTKVFNGVGTQIGTATAKLSSGTLAPITNTAQLSIGSKTGGLADGGDQLTGKMDKVVITSG